jgi:glycosyltransferase involved in cell wall biosynthesis
VVGSDSVSYGGALCFTGGRSFREHVLAEHDYDLTRFRFLGRVEPSELVQIFSVSDLHVYQTVPFVLSWSMLNAMACGCTVVGSDTAPVRELIEHDVNGALCDFFDAAALAHSMRELLARPERRAALGAAARGTITERYSLEATLPRMLGLYERAAAAA